MVCGPFPPKLITNVRLTINRVLPHNKVATINKVLLLLREATTPNNSQCTSSRLLLRRVEADVVLRFADAVQPFCVVAAPRDV